jgi:predicted dinucleotide-binding enzyme
MKVGVLGTGDVGKALGNGMLLLGHEVMLSGREAENASASAWAGAAGPRASYSAFADAAKYGEIFFLATRGMATEEALRMAGPANFAGKIVVDATNPLEGMPPALAISGQDSLGERVQRLLSGARVVKAFNTVGNTLFVRPKLSAKPDMFLAGNEDAAKAEVGTICEAWGWGVVDLGGIESARYCEALAVAWIINGFRNNAWNVAYKLIS